MTLAATRDFTSLSICADDAHEGMICGDLVPAHTTSAAERPHGRDDRRSWDAAYVLISPSISAAAFALRLGRLVRTTERDIPDRQSSPALSRDASATPFTDASTRQISPRLCDACPRELPQRRHNRLLTPLRLLWPLRRFCDSPATPLTHFRAPL